MGLSLHNGVYLADICGLDEEWSTVSDEDKATVEAGCPDILRDVTCDQFQVPELVLAEARENMRYDVLMSDW